jgi:hypothetical protein
MSSKKEKRWKKLNPLTTPSERWSKEKGIAPNPYKQKIDV